jgi:LysR family transcriptional regulator for bpeEF and oprC
MDRFQAMQVFVRVVDSGSFSKAAETLDLQRTSVTNMVKNLESLLGVRLLQRTTRSSNLTPEGADYYERCVRLLGDLAEAEASVAVGRGSPRGKLRVDMPPCLARFLVLPALPDFKKRYPDIELTIGTSDRTVDLIQDGIDCVIRGGPLEDFSLVARRVGACRLITCATPGYLKTYGEPKTLEDLGRHVAVNYFFPRSGKQRHFNFVVDGKAIEVKMANAVSLSEADAHLTCGLQGFGLIQSADFMVLPHVMAGRLKEVLPQWHSVPVPFSVVYPHRGRLSPKVRVFVDWVAEVFEQCPMLAGGDLAARDTHPLVDTKPPDWHGVAAAQG